MKIPDTWLGGVEVKDIIWFTSALQSPTLWRKEEKRV
jgi:hypothetical protein